MHAPLAQPAAREDGADIALQDVREARVAQEDAEGLVVEHTLSADPHSAGTMIPSWKISVASGEMLPARSPPMFQKWPQVWEKIGKVE